MAGVRGAYDKRSVLVRSVRIPTYYVRYAREASICEPDVTLRVGFVPSCAAIGKEKSTPLGVPLPMAAELGFEPRHTESESAVLPLHNSARYRRAALLIVKRLNILTHKFAVVNTFFYFSSFLYKLFLLNNKNLRA